MTSLRDRVDAARAAWTAVRTAPTATKNAVLADLAARLEAGRAEIRAANDADLARAAETGLPSAKVQRLRLDDAAIARMAAGLRTVAELPDPVGAVTTERTRPNGLGVTRVRCPIGVIAMIYEARPAVTIDAFALCFKAGNTVILKGGREADAANRVLAELARDVLVAHGLPADALVQLTATTHDDVRALLSMDDLIDLVIPRGGEALIRMVAEVSRIPTVQHYHGVCHLYVDEHADLAVARSIAMNGKTSAPATCNALECILVHAAVADEFVPYLARACVEAGVELRGDPGVCALAPDATPAEPDDYGREFLDLILAARIVPDLDAAVDHIVRYGSCHTDAIVTRDEGVAKRFVAAVPSSCVLVNASTRFNDGFELGLGAEIGISTQRVHAYGPMGLEELTVQRYVVHGDGQVR